MVQQLLDVLTLVAFLDDVHSNPPIAKNNPAAATIVVARPTRTTFCIRITVVHTKNKSIGYQRDLRMFSADSSGSYL